MSCNIVYLIDKAKIENKCSFLVFQVYTNVMMSVFISKVLTSVLVC